VKPYIISNIIDLAYNSNYNGFDLYFKL